jgi:hypothetical protein
MKNHSFKIKSFIIVCGFVLISNGLLAQNPIELTNILAAPVISETTYPIQQLSRGVVPTMYLKLGAISNVDPQVEMIRVITDIASISELYNQNSQFKNIELILIQIENESDLNWKLNANYLNQFEKLKYLYISSSIALCEPSIGNTNCEKEKINSYLSGELNPSITLVYSSEVSE